MTEIKRLIQEKGVSIRSLTQKLNATRYIIEEVMNHPPKSNAQREVARRLLELLRGQDQDSSNEGQVAGRAPRLPLMGEIPAGPLTIYDGVVTPEEYVDANGFDPARHFALRVRGNSMEPEFKDRDVIICRKVEDATMPVRDEGPTPLRKFAPYQGRVICALIDGVETTLKRLQIKRTGSGEASYITTLEPFNTNFPPISIEPENSFAVQGEVVGLIRRF